MAWSFDVNNAVGGATPDEIGELFLIWKDKGVTLGILEVLGSGDGIATFENSGQTAGPNWDVLTGGTSVWNSLVANEFSNTQAWMRVRMVGTTLEFVIRRRDLSSGSYEDDFQMKLSATGFTSGGANATTPPTATDEKYILGTGATSYAAFGSYTAASKAHIGFNQVANGDGFYSFYIVLTLDSSKATQASWIFDAMADELDGDLQPWATRVGSLLNNSTISAWNAWWAYRDYGGGTELLDQAYAYHYLINTSSQVLFPAGAGVQPGDGKSRSCPIVVGSYPYNIVKGISDVLEWKGDGSRSYPDTVNLATADAKVYVDHCLLPWEQGTTPL